MARFGPARLIAIFGLTAGVAAALMIFTMSMNGSGEALLYSGLEPDDAATVVERLDQAGVRYSLREGGTAIFVDAGSVDEARMRVASAGPLGYGSVGYEIFDQTDALGTTSYVQSVNARRALEGELARSINSLSSVSGARVHLVLPERRAFSRDVEDPSASVILNARRELDAGQVATIRNLIATAVPGLEPGRITIADQAGRLLASPNGEGAATAAALEDRRSGFEAGLRSKIVDVLEGVVGPGRSRVVVTAELSRESMTESSEQFDPDGQVLRSTETSEERSSDQDGSSNALVSASENLPADETQGADGRTSTSSSDRTSEIRNFEISTTNTTRVLEAGGVERLSVAVAVDGVAGFAEDGSMTWEPRSEEEMQQIRELVAAAMGFTQARGDTLEVRNLRFDRPDLTLGTPAPEGFSLGQLDYMRIAEIAVLFITALLIVFLVARPLVKGVSTGPAPAGAIAGAGATGVNPAIAAASNASQALLPEDGSAGALPAPAGEDDDNIDIAQIDGQVKKSSVRKVSTLVEGHPEESLAILRTWMHET
ncbi:MAG: flagellar basal-body MS-ring/collar protein FliF [Pseudomonadota bacterium]